MWNKVEHAWWKIHTYFMYENFHTRFRPEIFHTSSHVKIEWDSHDTTLWVDQAHLLFQTHFEPITSIKTTLIF